MRNNGLPRVASAQLGKACDHVHQCSVGSADSPRYARRPLQRWSIWLEEAGATAFVFALVATAVTAVIGLGIDVIGWYRTDRALQNAADAAAIAAARNATSSYGSEAKAVAANYGF